MFQTWNHPSLPVDVHSTSRSSQILLVRLWIWSGMTQQQVTIVEELWPWPAILHQGHYSCQGFTRSGSQREIMKAMLLPACSSSMFRVRSFYAFAFVRCLLHLAVVFAPVTKLERYIGITVFVCPCTGLPLTHRCVPNTLQFEMTHHNYVWYVTMMHKRRSSHWKGKVEDKTCINSNQFATIQCDWDPITSDIQSAEYIPYSFRRLSLGSENDIKSHEKKPQIKNDSFTDYHSEGLIMKAYFNFLKIYPEKKSTKSFVLFCSNWHQ